MPVKVKKTNQGYCVVDASNKIKKGRCHATKAKATRQAQAININTKKKR